MRRPLSIAALALLLCLPLSAQMRSGARGGGGFRGGAVHVSSPSGRAHGSIGFGSTFTHGGFGRPGAFPFHHHHHFFGARAYGYPWYGYYPGYWDYESGYSDYDLSYEESQRAQSYQAQMVNDQQRIEQRLNELEERLDRLSEQKSAPAATQAPAHPQRQSEMDTSQPAVLVYKDGHTQEIQNYAIVGQTIWILNQQQAKRVPLSALDLNATRKANQDRDIDLPLPPANS